MERPAKKPRLQGPEGFQKSKPASRYKPPESITKFVSAFDSESPSKQAGVAPLKEPSKKKPGSVTVHERQRNPFVDFDVPREPKAGPSKPPNQQLHSTTLASVHPSHVDKPLPPLKVLKPPVFLPVATSLQTTSAEQPTGSRPASTRPSAFQPIFKPPTAPPEKPKSVLKPPPPPVPSKPLLKPSTPLKPLVPPPLPEQLLASPKKHMKTILTTSVAQATDPTKEGSGAELLSLFLQQHGHGFVSSADRELQRGVMVSPDKRSRGKDPKFVRGGLAERLQHRISCTKTDFVLWKRQMERKLESGAKVAPDAQLRILCILDLAKPSDRPRIATPRSGLALCRLTRRGNQPPCADLVLGTYVVLFHFSVPNGGPSGVSGMERFEAGNEVGVWMPWHRVALTGCAGLLEMCKALDALTPPRSLLVVSRFCVVAPRVDAM